MTAYEADGCHPGPSMSGCDVIWEGQTLKASNEIISETKTRICYVAIPLTLKTQKGRVFTLFTW